ncbi:MAG: hypothetical protein ACYCQI_16720 [Gammaproteobacteria bacterium]
MCSSLPNSPVEDTEILYRSVRKSEIIHQSNGEYVISSSAFNDKQKMQPSVDRAILQNNDPAISRRFSPTDAVVFLKAGEVRKEKVSKAEIEYALDVKPDPLEENHAHAIIVPAPQYKNPNAFKKVKESLARLAKIALHSSD